MPLLSCFRCHFGHVEYHLTSFSTHFGPFLTHFFHFSHSLFPIDDVRVRFSDIGALARQKELLRELISLPLQRPDIFRTGVLRQNVSGVLLYGPPGTGKTMLAKAVAAESGANFLSLSAASIHDKFFGEGEKNARVRKDI